MEAFICDNNVKEVLNAVQQYIDNKKELKSIKLVESNDKQCIIIMNDSEIDDKMVEIWWSGYTQGMKSALT